MLRGRLGRPYLWSVSCSSTQDVLGDPHLPEGAVAVTEHQTAGRGRTGRSWEDAPGAALLLNYLISRATIPEYQVRWSWQQGDIAVWDNRCTQHYALNDYWPAPRKMERAAIVGDTPY